MAATVHERLLEACAGGDLKEARGCLETDPEAARTGVAAAAACGEIEALGALLQASPEAVSAPSGSAGWPPLLFAAWSPFLRFDPVRRPQVVAAAKLLLEAGADPKASVPQPDAPDHPRTALYGACAVARSVAFTRILLEAGADPSDGTAAIGPETLYHSAEHPENDCLRLLLAAPGAKPDQLSYCLGRKLDFEDPEGVRLFLEAGADPNFENPFGRHETRIHKAILNGRSPEVLELLIAARGDVHALTADGHSPLMLATRLGRTDLGAILRNAGANGLELSEIDEFLGVCALADPAAARAMMRKDKTLLDRARADAGSLLADLAFEDRADAVALMLELGFDPETSGAIGPALHHAAWRGHRRTVEVLLAHGAALESLNAYGGTPLGAALHGALHCHSPEGGVSMWGAPADVRHGDYPGVIERLLDAGADPTSIPPFPIGHTVIDRLLEAKRPSS